MTNIVTSWHFCVTLKLYFSAENLAAISIGPCQTYSEFFHTIRINISSDSGDDNISEYEINKVPAASNRSCVTPYLIRIVQYRWKYSELTETTEIYKRMLTGSSYKWTGSAYKWTGSGIKLPSRAGWPIIIQIFSS